MERIDGWPRDGNARDFQFYDQQSQGKISEVILCKGVLSDTDRSNVETYMNNTWVAAIPELSTWAILTFGTTAVVALCRRRA